MDESISEPSDASVACQLVAFERCIAAWALASSANICRSWDDRSRWYRGSSRSNRVVTVFNSFDIRSACSFAALSSRSCSEIFSCLALLCFIFATRCSRELISALHASFFMSTACLACTSNDVNAAALIVIKSKDGWMNDAGSHESS